MAEGGADRGVLADGEVIGGSVYPAVLALTR
jgi:hypothetical protein